MDRFVYTAMTGAKSAMSQLAATSHNLANVQTPGFRAMLAQYRAVDVRGDYADARAAAIDSTPGANFVPGAFQSTDQPLDVALREQGFFSLITPWGETVYTRQGRFSVNERGWLVGAKGWPVRGQQGPVEVGAQVRDVRIHADGTVWVVDQGQTQARQIDKLLLVRPLSAHMLQRRPDGLFGAPQPLAADPQVQLTPGGYEQSNVNPAEVMVQMIENSRMFDLNMQLIKNADQNGKSASALLSLARN